MAQQPNEEALARAVRYYEESKAKHSEFVQKVEARYKAYRGILESTSDAASWTSKAHPPYIQHIVETTLASLLDDKLRFRVRPRMTSEYVNDPQAAERARAGARAHQLLNDFQLKEDGIDEIQRPFSLQQAIAGLTVAKTFWRTEKQVRRSLKRIDEPVMGPFGPLMDPTTGQPVTVSRMVESTGPVTVYDGPTTEVRDVRDFGWHEAAVDIRKSRYLWDRVWLSPEDVLDGFKGDDPVFGPERGGWAVAEVKDRLDKRGTGAKDELGYREQELFQMDRTKDLVAVVEVWDQIAREVTTFVAPGVLLSHRPFPFWHGQAPFVVCSTQPDLFRIPGISQVEKIAHLQTLLWDLQNQRIDNLRLINNAIFMFAFDAEDADQYEFEPGARWALDDPTKVNMWAPNVIPAEVSLGAEALIKGDLQNLAGGFPFTSGADSQTVDQKTATGASIVSSLAQRSVNLAKGQLDIAWGKIGKQRMLLNQQFLREATVIPVVGEGGEEYAEEIEPELLQGDYSFEREPGEDKLMKQEEQAAAMGLLQTVTQLIGPMAALAQAGVARMLNLDAFLEDFLHAYGKDDVDRYFISQAPALPGAGVGPGQPSQPGTPTQPGQAVTGPGSIDPAVSPSAQTSLSPTTMLQRALALSAGGQNAPTQ